MEHNLLQEVILLLMISVFAIALLRRLNLPSIIGYLTVGIVAGPHSLAWISDSMVASTLGEIGVVFLLFTIGLDFSITQFRAMRKTLLGLGSAQVFFGTLSAGIIITWGLDVPWQSALIAGGALTLSSTAIVVKQLIEQVELQTEHGHLSLSILLFQDFAAVPFLVLIPILAQGESLGWPLFNALIKGVLALFVLLIIGRWALRPIFHEVAASRSAELFTLAVLLISLAAAWLTGKLGLSLAFGAFLAGMMLSETEYRHQIETEIRPFRDILLGLFFIVVGMQLDLSLFPIHWPLVLLLVAGLIAGKGLLVFLLLRVAGYDNYSSVRTGMSLAHTGELGIALLFLSVVTGLISLDNSQPVLMAVIVSMVLAPILIKYGDSVYTFCFEKSAIDKEEEFSTQIKQASSTANDHVVLCGYGRVGQQIGNILEEQGIKFIGLDINSENIKVAWHDNENVFFGDATNIRILEAARLNYAKALLVCVDDKNAALKIVYNARQISNEIPILLRARDESSIDMYLDAGVDEVIPETLEASTMIATQLLLLLGKSPNEVSKHIIAHQSKRYPILKKFFNR